MAQMHGFDDRLHAGPGPTGGVGGRLSKATSGLSAYLRLGNVPRPVLWTLGVLLAVAVCLGVVLRAVTAGDVGLSDLRRGASASMTSEADGSSSAERSQAQDEAIASQEAGGTRGTAVGSARDDASAAEGDVLVVDVGGAVVSPGVYRLPPGSRVIDAVHAAGGQLGGADLGQVNLAAPVADGTKVVVPYQGEAQEAAQPSTAAPVQEGGALVNINTADAEELESLPGVGESTAAAIIEERQANGPFAGIEDLMRVSGIGEKKFSRLQDLICA